MSYAETAPSPRRPKGVNHGAKRLTMKELLADKARIDAAMDQVEAAKAKARAQRAEYGKYLAWKVDLQRKERKAREAEDVAMRERVEEKLRQVLKEHREQSRKELTKWSDFRTAKVPKPRTLNIANGLAEEEAFVAASMEARRQHIDESTHAFRSSLPPKSAPTSSHHSPRKPPPQYLQPTVVAQPGQPPVATAGTENPPSPGGVASAERILERSRATGELDMPSIASMMILPPVATSNITVIDHDSGEVGVGTPSKADVHRKKETAKSKQHLSSVTDMYDKARTRRLYATGRMLADPPADYMLGSDILRYIPADVLQDQPTGLSTVQGPVPSTSDTVFLTQDQHITTAPPDEREQHDPQQQATQGPLDGLGTGTAQTAGKRLKWKRWNPDAWMQLPESSSIKLIEHRQKEEEDATYEWYRNYYEQYTKVKKRTEHHGKQYSWKRVSKHVLPPVESIRFDEQ